MTVFAVFKEGVYRHECGGIFTTYDAAFIAAAELISGENDDYHKYSIVPFDLDKISENEGIDCFRNSILTEPDPVCVLKRKRNSTIVQVGG